MALIAAVPDTPKLNLLTVAEHPLYIAFSTDDPLVYHNELHLQDLNGREWILPAQHANPHLYELIQVATLENGITATDKHYVMSAEEASQLVLAHKGVAFLTRTGAWRIARDEITMRPLVEERLRLVTKLATRADDRSRLVSEFVRAAGRKLTGGPPVLQGRLPLSG
jgi:DNA-binding transcriptional LysR family regulator